MERSRTKKELDECYKKIDFIENEKEALVIKNGELHADIGGEPFDCCSEFSIKLSPFAMLAFLSLLSLTDQDKRIAAFEAEVCDYLKHAEEINYLLESEKKLRKEGDEQLVKARGTLSNKL